MAKTIELGPYIAQQIKT